jgi:hypothetical protein
MDWEVQVATKTGQIKTVKVYDYAYPEDAKRAALAQTGADRIIWASTFINREKSSDSSSIYQNSNWSSGFDFDFDTKFAEDNENIIGFIQVTILPTIILLFIHPVLAILFNIALIKFWFFTT